MEKLLPNSSLVDSLLSDELHAQRFAQRFGLGAQLSQSVIQNVVSADFEVEVDSLNHAHQPEAAEEVADHLVVLDQLGL